MSENIQHHTSLEESSPVPSIESPNLFAMPWYLSAMPWYIRAMFWVIDTFLEIREFVSSLLHKIHRA